MSVTAMKSREQRAAWGLRLSAMVVFHCLLLASACVSALARIPW
jgi:hypothetical protein